MSKQLLIIDEETAAISTELMEKICKRRIFVNCSPSIRNCVMCSGEACNFCGAGCWNHAIRNCNHDQMNRHRKP